MNWWITTGKLETAFTPILTCLQHNFHFYHLGPYPKEKYGTIMNYQPIEFRSDAAAPSPSQKVSVVVAHLRKALMLTIDSKGDR